jgi:glutaconate CoA-transferase subunit A
MSSRTGKVTTLAKAIKRFVKDGCSVVTGTYMEQKIPFAAAHEIIRQGRRDLTLIGPISDILFDQLIGAGCVRRVEAAWVGNVMMGSAYNFRRAAEEQLPRALEVIDYTNFTLALGLHAAALGVPFLPTFSTLGTTLGEENPNFVPFADPTSPVGGNLVAVKAIHPDVAIVHACKADAHGNGMVWGNVGVTPDAVAAAERVIVIAEEIVDSETLRRDPNRILIPGFQVDVVCHVPFGCHPSPVQGYYDRDNQWFSDYHKASRTAAGFDAWLRQWVLDVPNWASYLERVGPARIEKLRPSDFLRAEPIATGHLRTQAARPQATEPNLA